MTSISLPSLIKKDSMKKERHFEDVINIYKVLPSHCSSKISHACTACNIIGFWLVQMVES